MKIVSIHQPHYHPWLGLLHKIANSDEHILLDDVQFRKRNFQNRAQYSSTQNTKLLSLSVHAKGHQTQDLKIHSVALAPQNLHKHFLTLKHRYGQTPGWHLIAHKLEALYSQTYESLVDINFATLELAMDIYGVTTPLIRSSELGTQGKKNTKLIELCLKRRATHYLSGNGARQYMDDLAFARNGIQVEYQNFEHPVYPQYRNTGFQPGCLALDFVCQDPDAAASLFHSRQSKSITRSLQHKEHICVEA